MKECRGCRRHMDPESTLARVAVLLVGFAAAFMAGYAVGTWHDHQAAPPPVPVQAPNGPPTVPEPPALAVASVNATAPSCTPWNPNDHGSAPANPCP